MGLEEPVLFEDDQAILDHMLQPFDLDFAELKERGTIYPEPEPVILWSDLAFPTPSGRIELASDQAEADGHPLTALPDPLPRPAGDLLRLLTPASEWHMNSSYDNEARIRARTDPQTVTLHPDDAAARGLSAGERVRVWNETGEIALALAVDDLTPAGVAWAPKGRWPSHADEGLNLNALNPGLRSDIGDSTALHGVEVRVEAQAQAR